ncbi:MAG: hypothetical protein IPK37_03930 [Austwickia sp.]|jgi:hypothetical protein|nr:MAG: hypothetical protein IPK37_03930 [Austwickia sp.]
MTEPSGTPASSRPTPRDRVHIDPRGLVLTDSDLALLARGLGRVVTWPVLRGDTPAQATHVATIRSTVFGGRPGGNMLGAMTEYDRTRKAAGQPEAFGPHFIATCQIAAVKETRRAAPASKSPDVGGDVLRMWLSS